MRHEPQFELPVSKSVLSASRTDRARFLPAFPHGAQDDPLDKGTDEFAGLRAPVLVIQLLAQRLELFAVEPCHIGRPPVGARLPVLRGVRDA